MIKTSLKEGRLESSPCLRFLANFSDSTIQLTDTNTNTSTLLDYHQGKVTYLQFDRDSRFLASASLSMEICVYCLGENKLVVVRKSIARIVKVDFMLD